MSTDGPMSGERLKILLVDDDEIDRLAIIRYVQREGLPYDIEKVASRNEALIKLRHNVYDIALLDYNLPDGTGLDILSEVGETPAIFVTGSGDERTAVTALRYGAYDYLIKDPERNYLIVLPATINNVLDRKRAERALIESEIKHRLLLNSIHSPVLALKDDMTIFYCNDAYAEFVHRPIAELEGKTMLNLLPALGDTPTYQAYLRVMETGNSQTVDGTWDSKHYLSYVYRTPWGILAVSEDITEIKQAQQALQRANEELETRVAARTADLAEANIRLQRSYNDTIKAITAAMDAKDSYTRGHSEEVKRITLRLGAWMGLPEDQLHLLEYASLLHDIGKIGISDVLLTKSSQLTEPEYDTIKQHPGIGGRLVEQIELLKEVGSIISSHHEKWDGTGYPRGLKGRDIPLEARIISIADAYEAMTSDRPYRKAYEEAEAKRRLAESSGTQFDPAIVKVFLEMELNTTT